ncbi:hypothetical protein [Robertmurraya siralis]|uniref:hypothetical protein n=1 Tax=Robertmurraya siralis TaxID=77777 RepID=UPI0010F9F031|nr:hypothetical protein [Robertmurraya siralis]
MATFDDLKSLEKYLNSKINSALQNEVFSEVKKTMQQRIERDVYEAYTPYSTDGTTPHYQRTGKLNESIDKSMEGENVLVVENTRNENGRDIVKVIEEGKDYEWGYKRNLDKEIGSRPFVKNTRDELSKSNKLERAMKDGLRRQGLNVE